MGSSIDDRLTLLLGGRCGQPIRRGDHLYFTDGRCAARRLACSTDPFPQSGITVDDPLMWEPEVLEWHPMPAEINSRPCGRYLASEVLGVVVQTKYLLAIRDLPCIQLGTVVIRNMQMGDIRTPARCLRFRFDGGEGVIAAIMPED
jgi:hypothetical protein